jgi:hypothetical protein
MSLYEFLDFFGSQVLELLKQEKQRLAPFLAFIDKISGALKMPIAPMKSVFDEFDSKITFELKNFQMLELCDVKLTLRQSGNHDLSQYGFLNFFASLGYSSSFGSKIVVDCSEIKQNCRRCVEGCTREVFEIAYAFLEQTWKEKLEKLFAVVLKQLHNYQVIFGSIIEVGKSNQDQQKNLLEEGYKCMEILQKLSEEMATLQTKALQLSKNEPEHKRKSENQNASNSKDEMEDASDEHGAKKTKMYK